MWAAAFASHFFSEMADGSSDSEPEVTGMAGANMSAPPRGIPVLASAAAVYFILSLLDSMFFSILLPSLHIARNEFVSLNI